MELKVLVNNHVNNKDYINFLQTSFEFEKIIEIEYKTNEPITEKIDLVLFTGGEDVEPKYYGELKNSKTRSNYKRDDFETKMFNFAVHNNIPCLGICRGAQLLTVLNNGSLFQHVEGHNKDHAISVFKKYYPKKEIKGKSIQELHFLERHNRLVEQIQEVDNKFSDDNLMEVFSTSTHHQMMDPFSINKQDYELIAFSTYHQSNVYEKSKEISLNVKKYNNFVEPEIVFYKKNGKHLAIQGHPEFETASDEFKTLTKHLINNLLLK